VLGEGTLLGIYPEGTRSPDSRASRATPVLPRYSRPSGAVVVPCAMINTDVVQPQGRIFPKLRPRPGVRFGKPLDFSRYEGMSGDRFVERSMTDEIMYELMQLSGQEYVDQYAAKVKKSQGKDAAFGSPGAADVREIGDRAPKSRAS
jgi:1-acyl-sn-glycerol-3-phosphate acyltransferase